MTWSISIMSENDVELLTNVLSWTPVELAKQYFILLLETVKFWGRDLLTDVVIGIGRFRNKRLLRATQL